MHNITKRGQLKKLALALGLSGTFFLNACTSNAPSNQTIATSTDDYEANLAANESESFYETESETFDREALYRTDDDNKPAEGWITNADGTMGYCQNGYLLTGYQMIDDSRYLFSDDGIMQTGRYVDENGAYQGYDVYFARRLGEDLGVEINFVSTEAANRIEYLQTGKADVILANFTVTPERAEEVDFALPYMNVALGVISPDSNVITTLDNWNADDQMIVISGTTAETYLTKEYPDIPLQKYDSYATAKNALENGNGVAWANDNTEVIAFAKQNPGYTVGIPSLGSQDTIAPAVSQGNTTVLDWLNEEIKALGEENFFHKDYEETLVDTYGLDYENELVVEGGVTGGADAASSEAASSEAASSEAAASEVASSAAAQ